MSTGRLMLRATVGGFFVGHGTQKLFGWFGGHGLDGTTEMFANLGLRPARANAIAAGASEAAGGLGLLLGAATPLAASAVIGTMVTAIRKVHLASGPWVTNGGYEYNAVLIAAAATLAEVGPGRPSVDGDSMHGPGWAALALALGVAGSFAADAVSERLDSEAAAPPPETATDPEDAAPAPTDVAATPDA